MSAPPADEVAAAVAAWTWVPDRARAVRTPGALVIRLTDHLDVPLAIRLEPLAPTEVDRVLGEALAAAGTLDHPWVVVQTPLGAPAELGEALLRRGATVHETLEVLAADVRVLDPAAPEGVLVEHESEQDLRVSLDERRVAAQVFGGDVPPVVTVAEEVAGADDRRVSGQEWRGVAYVDGRPVGVAGCVLVDGVLRLWGGAVLPVARGRGVYRALLQHRLAWGRAHGASTALVKGRVETSGPILRRAGFTGFGTVRDYRVDL